MIKLQERFDHLSNVRDLYGFLFDLHSPNISIDHCMRLEVALTSENDNNKDINGTQLFDEIKSFQMLFDKNEIEVKSPIETMNKIHEIGLAPIYPNLMTALQVFLTLPVTIASAESSFSKLKLIKNYLRTSMGQERLSNLATLSIESDLLETIDLKDAIKKFVATKARQIVFS